MRVWLSDARVLNGGTRFRRFGRSRHIDLGPLRANRGNTNYVIPGDADTAGINSVILWCNRFGVSFGAAPLHHP
ncbi:DM13 domain-containing protein [Mycobacterium sp. URHB0021]